MHKLRCPAEMWIIKKEKNGKISHSFFSVKSYLLSQKSGCPMYYFLPVLLKDVTKMIFMGSVQKHVHRRGIFRWRN